MYIYLKKKTFLQRYFSNTLLSLTFPGQIKLCPYTDINFANLELCPRTRLRLPDHRQTIVAKYLQFWMLDMH